LDKAAKKAAKELAAKEAPSLLSRVFGAKKAPLTEEEKAAKKVARDAEKKAMTPAEKVRACSVCSYCAQHT
jgi:hypothetical protein